jgi:hypothetical protein
MNAPARFAVFAITVALVCCGCAHNYTTPTPTYYKAGTFDGSDTIGYQTLRRGDFKATAPPSEGKGMPEAAAAALVGAVKVAPGSEFSIIPVKTGSDSTLFEATTRNLHFHAIMDRAKSWWRAELDSISTAYVLEHEQIHFAIFELAARSLNARIPEIATRIRSTGRTPDDARRTANARLEEELEASNQKLAERQSEFERDTSNGMNRSRQKKWWDRIQAELAATAPSQ